MTYSMHDARDCACVYYKADFSVGELRLIDGNFYCARCNRYVSPKKWKGGIVHFNFRTTRFVPHFQCPCCGYRMRTNRRGKARIRKSIQNQTDHPEKYTTYVLSKLAKKQKLLKNNILIPTVM